MRLPYAGRTFALRLMAATSVVLLGCQGEVKQDNGVDPNLEIAQVIITPGTISIPIATPFQFAWYGINQAGDSVDLGLDWTADGGTLTKGGQFSSPTAGVFKVVGRAPIFPNPADTVMVTVTAPAVTLTDIVINPISPILAPGELRPFLAEAHFSDSSVTAASVNWTATGGTIDQAGVFTAGNSSGTFQVIATSTTSAIADTVPLTITSVAPPTVTSVVLAPDTVTLTPGGQTQFNAFANYSDGTFAPAQVTYTVSAGSITSAGRYTAGQVPGTYKVIARHVASGQADTSDVTVAGSTLVRITLTPPTVALVNGAKQQFTVTGTFTDSSTAPVAVNFTATGGIITAGGLYTAGQVNGPFNVFATTANTLFADTATVQINSATVTLTKIVLSPATFNALIGANFQVRATGQFSDGTQAPVNPVYTVTGGSITAGGLYTAPQVAGTYRIIGAIGNVADTTVATISSPATLTGIVVSPSTATILPGGIQQFTVAGQLSNGGTTTVNVTWSATCGSILANGQYTAPNAPTTCTVTATQVGGSFTDNAAVTVANLPPTNNACSNEPAGQTVVFDTPWNAVPPVGPQVDQFGWLVRSATEAAKLSIIQDGLGPLSPPSAIAGKFPQGSRGGAAPFRLTRNFSRNTTSIYMCIFTELDPAFTNNGNAGTKFGFWLTPYVGGTFGLNHYFNLSNNVGINLQFATASMNRNMLSSFSLIGHRGTWVKMELLVVANTPGNSDGIARIWANDVQVLNVQNVQYFYPSQTPAFNGVTWNPTYGGGTNPVPYNMFQFIDHWYLSIK